MYPPSCHRLKNIICRRFGSPFLGEATAAPGAALPIPANVAYLPVFGMVNVRTDVDRSMKIHIGALRTS